MKKIILSTLILFISVPMLKSQVTIGSSKEPAKGALLDLKTKNPDSDNVTVDDNGSGGLVLARVRLVDKNTLEPFIPTTDSDWQNKEVEMKKLHVGMMVYNLTSNGDFSPGVYVWNGLEWIKDEINATNGLTKTSDNIQLGGTLNTSTTIDQGTNPLIFSGQSASKIYMRNVKDNIPENTDNIATLGIDNTSGELFIMKANSTNGTTTKAISYIVYKLIGSGDWVQNFNTQIPANKYTVVVVGSNFTPKTANTAIYPGTAPYTIPNGAAAISNVFADRYHLPSTETTLREHWRIHADYVGASPKNNENGMWTINCLVINNSLVDVHSGFLSYGGAGGDMDLDAGSAPVGLQ
jgi:hypothetical protein